MKYKIIFVCLVSLLLNIIFFLPKIHTLPFNLDELAWINDGRFYTFLVQGQIQKFDFQAIDENGTGWGRLGYRSVDQPTIGKILYGFWIANFHSSHFYQKDYVYENNLFIQQQLNGVEMSQLDQFLSPETISAIQSGRILAFIFDCLLVMVFSVLALKLFHSLCIWLILLIGFFVHPILQSTFLLATTDGLSMLMILCLLSFLLKFHQQMLRNKIIFIAGLLVATTTAIKLNGFFYLFPFLILISKNVYLQTHRIQKIFFKLFFLTLVFAIFFVIFNPGLWLHPFANLLQIFRHRIVFTAHVKGSILPNYFFIIDNLKLIFLSFRNLQVIGWFLLVITGLLSILKQYHQYQKNEVFLTFFVTLFLSSWLYYIPGWSRYLAPLTIFYLFISGYGLKKLKG